MDIQLPESLSAEREALYIEIEQAFEGVDRDGGVSWSESVVIENRGSDAEREVLGSLTKMSLGLISSTTSAGFLGLELAVGRSWTLSAFATICPPAWFGAYEAGKTRGSSFT